MYYAKLLKGLLHCMLFICHLITEGNHRMRNTRSISLNGSQILRKNNRLQFLEIKSLSLVKSQILQSTSNFRKQIPISNWRWSDAQERRRQVNCRKQIIRGRILDGRLISAFASSMLQGDALPVRMASQPSEANHLTNTHGDREFGPFSSSINYNLIFPDS